MSRSRYLDRTRTRGVNPLVYWLVRAVLQPFFHLYFRLSRLGREHIPAEGGFILAANHRSFLDPFVIAVMARRPIHFVAKEELFRSRPVAWLLSSLGAFPIARGAGDEDAMATARELLARGEGVLIFPEGTRTRPGGLGRPRRGVGRLALESGAPVVPVAIIGSEDVRRGWRIRPRKVRIRAGRPLTFPRVERPSAELAGAVTDRIWPSVALQWEWLGGTPPLRRAVVVAAGSRGLGVAAALRRAGLDVRTAPAPAAVPELAAPMAGPRGAARPADPDLDHADLVVLAVPAAALPAVLHAHAGRIPARARVLLAVPGLLAPAGLPPSRLVAERIPGSPLVTLAGSVGLADAGSHGGAAVLASADAGAARQVADVLGAAGLDVTVSDDPAGLELAAAAAHAAVLAAAAAAPFGPDAASAAAGKVLAEAGAHARRHGGRPDTLAGPAGAGAAIGLHAAAGAVPEDAGQVPALLAAAIAADGRRAPAVAGLADVVAGERSAEDWARALTRPRPLARRAPARAA